MLLMIDNYDSFTYNLYQYFCELGAEVKVVRNDEIDIAGIEALAPSHLVISPGPVPRMKRGSRWRQSAILQANYPSSGCALAISLSLRYTVAMLSAPVRSCTARRLPSFILTAACLLA